MNVGMQQSLGDLDLNSYIPKNWRRQWHPTPVLLPGKSHGWRSLVGCRPWGHEESDTTERLHFHFFLSCIGEGNGNPLQCSCLENPRDRGAWWAAVYGVAQSRTQLKQLSSSSGIPKNGMCRSTLSSQGTVILFFIVVAPFCIPTNSVKFLASLACTYPFPSFFFFFFTVAMLTGVK